MAIMITDECLNCGACELECPNRAVYEGGHAWRWADGTNLTGQVQWSIQPIALAETPQAPLAEEHYYIVPGKCNECIGFHEVPQCAVVCPMEACVPDPDYKESREELLQKAQWLHQIENPFEAYRLAQQEKPKPGDHTCGCNNKIEE